MKRLFHLLKAALFQAARPFLFFRGMLVGGDDMASMAKTSFCLLFIPALYFWWQGQDVPPGHKEALLALLGYIFGGKVAWSISQFARNKGEENEQS